MNNFNSVCWLESNETPKIPPNPARQEAHAREEGNKLSKMLASPMEE